MHAAASNALRTACRPISRVPCCRMVNGTRFPAPRTRRSFHPSKLLRNQSNTGPEDNGRENEDSSAVKTREGEEVKDDEKKSVTSGNGRGNGRTTGGRARPGKQKAQNGLPPVVLPKGYWEKCVLCAEEERTYGRLLKKRLGFREGQNKEPDEVSLMADEKMSGVVNAASTSSKDEKRMTGSETDTKDEVSRAHNERKKGDNFSVPEEVYDEVQHVLQAFLRLRPPTNAGSQSITRPITVLQCPQGGAHDFLSSVVETVAQETRSDLLRLDAYDLAECLGLYVGENIAWQETKLSNLGYEVAHKGGFSETSITLESYSKEQNTESPLDAEDMSDFSPRTSLVALSGREFSRALAPLFASSERRRKKSDSTLGDKQLSFSMSESGLKLGPSTSDIDQWSNLKITHALERLIESAEEKQRKADGGTEEHPRNLIVHIKHYKEMMRTISGADLIGKLRAVIDKRWQEGMNIVCVGTTASQRIVTEYFQTEIQSIQHENHLETRNIYVPADSGLDDHDYAKLGSDQIYDINLRLIEEMARSMANGMEDEIHFHILEDNIELKRLELLEHDTQSKGLSAHKDTHSFGPSQAAMKEKLGEDLSSSIQGMRESVLAIGRVRRIVTALLGTTYKPRLTSIGIMELYQTMSQLRRSDEVKSAYGETTFRRDQDGNKKSGEPTSSGSGASKTSHKDRIAELSKKCNTYEKKMLKGVVLADNIKVSFDDIRAPEDTIEALKTLTSLSLLRPEAFSYGVLASDKIPGLLLYGPPGTGKTLLAKAVAKESGATVLEVSGADINDMYVGEGEKNVKAVFSLAKKLSPCIVFIDEADAIFAARGGAGKQRSHREMINQFLREWDGMEDLGAFIMIATNRPFDLDDAVLRRLPRRLLVDLPVERDREAILKIHLKEEALESTVDLAKLAKDTPFYSGSDLKNVCVAAALACIREENAEAAKWTGDDEYQYPDKRTLKESHFKKALEEISASINEDMSTLGQIRKFDERYGDRKGRRKKRPQMGFGIGTDMPKDSDSVRVRNLEVF